ncbi:MAG: AbrB/MazE/SpoVT family DNA-binding domain-containing protein [Nitrososphaerota archaeon]|nr:AbrB/MazE/SpoVT family DNA-binding domain-containing protein [Nitrososphaerota archaeon]
MAQEVVVTRRGQTTIPIKVRRKLGIQEGTRLEVEAVDGKIVFTKTPSIFDLAGTGKMSRKEAFKALDDMREE